jgi:hypothetical protein
LDPLAANLSLSSGGNNATAPHVTVTFLNDLDDGTLLCVLRLLPPLHRAIARLTCHRLNAMVGPVASQRLPLEPLLHTRPLPWGCVWEAFPMLRTSNEQQGRIAAAVTASGELEHLQPLWQHGCSWNADTCLRAEDMRICSAQRPPGGAAVGAGQLIALSCTLAEMDGHLEVLQWA